MNTKILRVMGVIFLAIFFVGCATIDAARQDASSGIIKIGSWMAPKKVEVLVDTAKLQQSLNPVPVAVVATPPPEKTPVKVKVATTGTKKHRHHKK